MHAWLSCVQVDGLNAPIAPEAKLRKPEHMEQQGCFAEAVGHFVNNTGNTRKKGNSEFVPYPLHKCKQDSPEEQENATRRAAWLRRVLPLKLEEDGLIVQLADGQYQDCHGQPWTYPTHQSWGTSLIMQLHDC
jgi:hypothetical protein